MRAVELVNVGLRFLLEMCALGLLSFWGHRTAGAGAARLALGVGVPILFAVAWGLLASPKAPLSLSHPLKVGVQVALLLVPAAALVHVGQPALGGAFAVVVLVNAVLLEVV